MTNKNAKIYKLGRNIFKYRKLKKLSQNQLAEILDISRNHLSHIEVGMRCPSIQLLIQIAEALSINEKDLFDFED